MGAAASMRPQPPPLAVGCALAHSAVFPAAATLRLLMCLPPRDAAMLTSTSHGTDTRGIEMLWAYYSARGPRQRGPPKSVAPRAYDRYVWHRAKLVVSVAVDAIRVGRAGSAESVAVSLGRSREACGATAIGAAIAKAVPRGAALVVVIDPFVLIRAAALRDGVRVRRAPPATEVAIRAERARTATRERM